MLINKKFFNKILCIGLLTVIAGTSVAAPKKNAVKEEYLHRLVCMATARILERSHLRQIPSDEALAEKIFESYFKHLDPAKVFFTVQDVNEFSRYR